MLGVAREMNLSETAFLYPRGAEFSLRWFTPAVEIDLCGHATLASAHILWEERVVPLESPITFSSASGPLHARRDGNLIELDFPLVPETEIPTPAGLVEALGAPVKYVARKGKADLLVEVDSEKTLRALRPNFAAIRELARGIAVTCRANEGSRYDFVSRYFAPREGIDEDPVTGSAHCCLAAYWQRRLGKNRFNAYQASARGGELEVWVQGDRVKLRGVAVTILRGTLAC